MWCLKWLILIIFFNQSPSSFLTEHLIERGINSNVLHLNFFSSIFINIRQLIPFCYLDDYIIIIIISICILYIIINFIRRKYGLKELILVLIGLVPILRYLVMFMHSYDHFFFTYRALLPSIMIFFILVKKNKR